MKTPITGVVPQPGATLPYSAFNGLKISPNLVLRAIIKSNYNYIIKLRGYRFVYNNIIYIYIYII